MAHILIIDDEPHILAILSELLSLDNHCVMTATNGNVGLEHLKQIHYDLVITDIVMPECDGFEVMTEMVRRYPQIKIIAMTGGSANLDRAYLLNTAQLLRAGRIVSKPLDLVAFRATVREVLQKP